MQHNKATHSSIKNVAAMATENYQPSGIQLKKKKRGFLYEFK